MTSRIEDIARELETCRDNLTDQQQAFAEFLADGLSQTTAARRAGYTGKHVNTTASRLVNHEWVQRYVAALLESRTAADSPVDRETIKRHLQRVMMTGTSAAQVSAAQALARMLEDEKNPAIEAIIGRDTDSGILCKLLDNFRWLLAEHLPGSKSLTPGDRDSIRPLLEQIARTATALANSAQAPNS